MMEERDHGIQPLDRLMVEWGFSNHDLVEASPEQLNHKQVQKARKGRQLTLHSMQKVTRALNIAIWNRLSKEQKENYFEYHHHWLFDYAKGYLPDRLDPNDGIKESLRTK
jgi:aspartate carbamoyltransferase catalytic subunit